MAQHLIAAIDEAGAKTIVSSLVSGLSDSVSDSFGPFSYSIDWEFVPGDFDLVDEDDIIRLREWDIKTDISLSLTIDLDDIIPELCTPRICIPYIGCTPRWCIDWPSKTFTVNLPTIVSEVSVDFSVEVEFDLAADQWVIKGVVNPLTLDIDLIDLAGTLEELFHDTIGDVLEEIPGIGPWLDDAIGWLLEFVVDLFDDLLEALFTALSDSLGAHPVLGIGFELHRVDALFEILPASGAEPAVTIRIDDLDAEITSDEEFVVSADIALP